MSLLTQPIPAESCKVLNCTSLEQTTTDCLCSPGSTWCTSTHEMLIPTPSWTNFNAAPARHFAPDRQSKIFSQPFLVPRFLAFFLASYSHLFTFQVGTGLSCLHLREWLRRETSWECLQKCSFLSHGLNSHLTSTACKSSFHGNFCKQCPRTRLKSNRSWTMCLLMKPKCTIITVRFHRAAQAWMHSTDTPNEHQHPLKVKQGAQDL